MIREEYLELQLLAAMAHELSPGCWPDIISANITTSHPHRTPGIKGMSRYYHHIQPGWKVEVYTKDNDFLIRGKVREIQYDTEEGHHIKIGVDWLNTEDYWIGLEA